MKNFIVNEGQSLIDIACELYGNAEMVVKLAQDNGLSITDAIGGRFVLIYDEAITNLIEVSTYFRLNNMHIMSADLVDSGMIEHSPEEHSFEEHN